MVVKWYTKAQEHWDEQLEYCAETFGVKTALDCVKTAEEYCGCLEHKNAPATSIG